MEYDSSDKNPGKEPSLLAEPDASDRRKFELTRPMKIGFAVALAAVAIVGLLTSSFLQNDDTSKASSEGVDSSEIKDRKEVANFELTDADGKKVSLADYKGKVVVMNFWNMECTNCLIDLPAFAQIQKRFGDDKIAVVSVNVDNNDQVKNFAKEYWAKNNFSFPAFFDPTQQTAAQLEVTTVPSSFVIDREGRIVLSGVGMTDWNDPGGIL